MRDMAAAMTTLISLESQNLKIVFYYILQLEGDNSQKQKNNCGASRHINISLLYSEKSIMFRIPKYVTFVLYRPYFIFFNVNRERPVYV